MIVKKWVETYIVSPIHQFAKRNFEINNILALEIMFLLVLATIESLYAIWRAQRRRRRGSVGEVSMWLGYGLFTLEAL